MNDTATLVIAIIGAMIVYTTSVVTLVMWLNNKFRSLEKSFYRELERRRAAIDTRFYAMGTRVQRLEIKNFGFTEPVVGRVELDEA